MVNVTLSPSTLPSAMVDLPVNELVVSPVTLLPSCLKVKVLSIAPFGPSAVAFQLPLMSAAHALRAHSATSAGSHFILTTPFNSRQYTSVTGPGLCALDYQAALKLGKCTCHLRHGAARRRRFAVAPDKGFRFRPQTYPLRDNRRQRSGHFPVCPTTTTIAGPCRKHFGVRTATR